jgi:hypothetical protein
MNSAGCLDTLFAVQHFAGDTTLLQSGLKEAAIAVGIIGIFRSITTGFQ